MKTPTPKQQAKSAIKWINALRTHKKTVGCLADGKGAYCCLGVGVKVLRTGESLKQDSLAPHLCERIGLFDSTGGFSGGYIKGAGALTTLNDQVYADDKTFKRMRVAIFKNLKKVFEPEVAKLLIKHYAKP